PGRLDGPPAPHRPAAADRAAVTLPRHGRPPSAERGLARAEPRRFRFRGARHAGAAAGVAGYLLAGAPDSAAAAAGALPGDPPADRARAQRADADEDAVVAPAVAYAPRHGADPRGGEAHPQSASRPARQGAAAAGDRRRLGVGARLDDADRPCRE